MSALLEATGVSKRFGGLQALEDVSFAIARDDIYGLIGPNGAGKTTLFNVLTGVYAPDAGTFRFDGRGVTALAPHEIAAAGIARTFQNIRLFANLSALATSSRVRSRCSTTSASDRGPTIAPAACRTATSAGWKSHARLLPSRACSRSMSPLRA